MSKIKNLPPLKIEMTIGVHALNVNPCEQLMVGEEDINQHIDECASWFTYYSVISADADNRVKALKHDFKVWMAGRKNEAMENCKSKLTSEIAKEDAVMLANIEEYATRTKAILEAEYQASIMSVLTEGWKVKKDMLISLSSNYRQELSTGISIKKWNDQFKKS